MSPNFYGPHEAALKPVSPEELSAMSREEVQLHRLARLKAEVADLLDLAAVMLRRWMNAWMHHPEYRERLTTLPEWAEARGVTRQSAYNLRRRHADFPRPVGGFGGALVFNRDELERWLQETCPRGRRGG